MGAGVIVNIIVDAVPPRIAPAVALEQLFKNRSGIERPRQPDRPLINQERPSRMVWDEAVVFEFVARRLPLAYQRFRTIRPLPAGCFLRNVFDAFQNVHVRVRKVRIGATKLQTSGWNTGSLPVLGFTDWLFNPSMSQTHWGSAG